MDKPKSLTAQIHAIGGISRPYASQIATGARRPAMGIALRIYDELGIALGPLRGKSKSEIAQLARAHKIATAA